MNRWRFWLGLSGIALLWCALYGRGRYIYEMTRYNARAAAAHQNEQFLTAYNTRRSGDVITIVGRAVGPSNRRYGAQDQFAWLELQGIDKTVILSGARVSLCDGNDVAASGTYVYDPQGGTLVVSDKKNIDWQFSGYAFRLDLLIWSFYPRWCGFRGMPINPN